MEPDNRWKQLAQWIAAFIIAEIREQLKQVKPQSTMSVRYMTIKQCSVYIGRSVTAIYRLVARREIPFIRNGRNLRFDKVAVDAWQQGGAI
jgi:excisionase family DNA binding protein